MPSRKVTVLDSKLRDAVLEPRRCKVGAPDKGAALGHVWSNYTPTNIGGSGREHPFECRICGSSLEAWRNAVLAGVAS